MNKRTVLQLMSASLATLLTVALIGCAPKQKDESPNDAAKAIQQLIQSKNYAELFPTRYSEWYKVDKEGVPHDKAIEKLSGQFEKQYDVILDVYTQLSTAEFKMAPHEHAQVTETGEMATATVNVNGAEVPYSLYKMKNGLWGFHL